MANNFTDPPRHSSCLAFPCVFSAILTSAYSSPLGFCLAYDAAGNESKLDSKLTKK